MAKTAQAVPTAPSDGNLPRIEKDCLDAGPSALVVPNERRRNREVLLHIEPSRVKSKGLCRPSKNEKGNRAGPESIIAQRSELQAQARNADDLQRRTGDGYRQQDTESASQV